MGARLLAAIVVGVAVGVILTRLVLIYDFIRIWLVNPQSLLVWAAAFVAGVVIAFIGPDGWEFSLPPISTLLGSVVGIVIFGTGLYFSLVDEQILSFILTNLLISGVCIMLLALLGGWLASAIRESQASNQSYGNRSRRQRRDYR